MPYLPPRLTRSVGGPTPGRAARTRSDSRTTAGLPSSRWPPAASALRPTTSPTRTRSRSRWRRVPSPERAASSPAPRCVLYCTLFGPCVSMDGRGWEGTRRWSGVFAVRFSRHGSCLDVFQSQKRAPCFGIHPRSGMLFSQRGDMCFCAHRRPVCGSFLSLFKSLVCLGTIMKKR